MTLTNHAYRVIRPTPYFSGDFWVISMLNGQLALIETANGLSIVQHLAIEQALRTHFIERVQ